MSTALNPQSANTVCQIKSQLLQITQWRQIGVLADLAGSSFGWSIGALHRLDASTKLPSLRGPAHSISVPPWRAQLVGWLDIRVIPSHAIELAAAS
jgi:hypothetical protein